MMSYNRVSFDSLYIKYGLSNKIELHTPHSSLLTPLERGRQQTTTVGTFFLFYALANCTQFTNHPKQWRKHQHHQKLIVNKFPYSMKHPSGAFFTCIASLLLFARCSLPSWCINYLHRIRYSFKQNNYCLHDYCTSDGVVLSAELLLYIYNINRVSSFFLGKHCSMRFISSC